MKVAELLSRRQIDTKKYDRRRFTHERYVRCGPAIRNILEPGNDFVGLGMQKTQIEGPHLILRFYN